MKRVRPCFKYIFLFVLFLLALSFFGYFNNQFDPIWNYGYSYAISLGEVPYRDFTLLTTPLFPFLFSIGLRLISQDNIVFLIEQALLLTATFYFLFQLFGKKGWLMLVVMMFPWMNTIVPTYNYFAFFLMVIVMFLEKEKKSDYLIGFILSLIILTKQSIGLFMLVPTFILYFKDYKKIIKRMIPVFILCFLFLFYLIITDSLLPFLDICVFGLFDFANSNGTIFTGFFFISLLLVAILLWVWKKDKKNILVYYSLCAFSFLIPIFTNYHFYIFFLSFMLPIIPLLPLPDTYIKWLSICLSITICIINFFLHDVRHTKVLKDVNNFNYYLVAEDSEYSFHQTVKLYNKYKVGDKSPIFLGTQSVYFTIVNNERVDYFDVLNRGNFGYDGTNKMIEKVKKMKNQVFIINMEKYKEAKGVDQLDTAIIKYVIDHSRKIDSWDCYYVYLKE